MSAKKRGLGKGLDALLGASQATRAEPVAVTDGRREHSAGRIEVTEEHVDGGRERRGLDEPSGEMGGRGVEGEELHRERNRDRSVDRANEPHGRMSSRCQMCAVGPGRPAVAAAGRSRQQKRTGRSADGPAPKG